MPLKLQDMNSLAPEPVASTIKSCYMLKVGFKLHLKAHAVLV